MPKDEFDFEDPLELNGVALLSGEDTSAEMADCFAEEFMRLGYNHKQVLALFRNPHYLGPNLVLQNRGEPFVREVIAGVFARWGRKIEWPCAAAGRHEEVSPPAPTAPDADSASPATGTAPGGLGENLTDPLGHPAPALNL